MKTLVESEQNEVTIKKQCELLDISKSGYYYEPKGLSDFNLELMNRIDEIYTESPEYGSRTIKNVLAREYGIPINRKRIQRLMRIMGLEAIYPKKNLSKPGIGDEHKVYPYLLKNLKISRPNQVWASDITYIRLKHGFVYLVAIIDWYSRKILSWEISTSMDTAFCISALERAIRQYGVPEIFNTDQGSQFTSKSFREVLDNHGIKISMDGKGRASDNIIIERFWRTLKYSEIYLKDYETPFEASSGIKFFITKYNDRRPHSSLNGLTPSEVYSGGAFEKIIA